MRPIAQQQSALRAPFNTILGTEANVRILRILGAVRSPISASELATRAKVQRSSVHRAIKALEKTGVVEYVGTGPQPRITLRERSALAKAMRQLFQAERTRYEELLTALTRAAGSIDPPPVAVWLEGSVASGNDQHGDPLVIGLVDNSRVVHQSAEAMREVVGRIEKRFAIQVEVRGRTRADLDALSDRESEDLLDAIPLLGIPPGGLLERYRDLWKARNIRGHSDHDERSLALGQALAQAIANDPSLVEEARRYVTRRWRKASTGERNELREWKRILAAASPASLRKLLRDPGERGTRLRQTNPFVGLLAPERPTTT